MGTSLLSRIISSSAIRLSFTIASAIIAFFMLPFLANYLSAKEYGIWAVIISIVGYYGVLDFGISTAVGRFVGRAYGRGDYDEINKVVTTAVFLFLITAVCLTLIAIGATTWFTFNFIGESADSKTIWLMVVILIAAFSSQFPVRAVSGMTYAAVSHHLIISVEYLKLSLKTGLTVFFILQGYSILSLAIIYAFSELIGNIILYFLTLSTFPFLRINKIYFSKIHIKSLVTYGWVAFIVRVTAMLKIKLLPAIVSGIIGIEYVILYVVALRLMEYIHQFVAMITGIFAPIFSSSEHNIDYLRNSYQYASSILVSIVFYIGLSILFYSKWLIPVWMGDGFEYSHVLVIIFCAPFMLMGIQYISYEMLLGLSKHKYCAIINTIEVTVGLLGGVILTHYHGIYGIALGFAIIVSVCEIVYPFIVAKVLNMGVIRTYLYTFIVPMLKITVPLIIFFGMAYPHIENNYYSLALWNILQFIVMVPFIYYFVLSYDFRCKLLSKVKLYRFKYLLGN